MYGDPGTFSMMKRNWTPEFTYLGIPFNINNMDNITERDYEQTMDKIRKLTRMWTPTLLTPLGIVVIIKNLLTSQYVHMLLSLPV